MHHGPSCCTFFFFPLEKKKKERKTHGVQNPTGLDPRNSGQG